MVGTTPLDRLSLEDLACRIAYVPQEELPSFRFTLRQVVVMGRMPYSRGFWDSPEDLAAADEAMRRADCLDLADRSITEVSAGERQRALLARAIAQDAPAMLMDEPTAHLDVGHQLAAGELMRALADSGKAVLVAVHDLNLASASADEGILLDRGTIGFHGPMEDLLEGPHLDAVYGVQFERVRDRVGKLRVLPTARA
jgi:iron complex transport system ATP-binding protein